MSTICHGSFPPRRVFPQGPRQLVVLRKKMEDGRFISQLRCIRKKPPPSSLKLRHHVISASTRRRQDSTRCFRPPFKPASSPLLAPCSLPSCAVTTTRAMTATKTMHFSQQQRRRGIDWTLGVYCGVYCRLLAHPCTDHPQVPSPTRYIASALAPGFPTMNESRRSLRNSI